MSSSLSDATVTEAWTEADLATDRDGGPGLQPGSLLGRYSILERIGRGGMGVVYAAYDPKLDRRVAVKVLRADPDDRRRQRQLVDEARALGRLNHPNVVTVHDVGDLDQGAFVAMEYIDGQGLDQWLAEDHTTAEILGVFCAAGQGLAAAHRAGLVHRDFKPKNVMLDADGRVVVMDFGIATGIPGADAPQLPVTEGGRPVGTPRYMSPEQFMAVGAGPASDQFSFCVALYEALFGRHPYGNESGVALATAVLEGEPAPPGRTNAPRAAVAAILRGLRRDPEQRWPDLEALLGQLAVVPKRARRWWPLAMLPVAVGVAWVWGAQTGSAPIADPCAGAEDRWTEVWGDDRRAEVRGALGRHPQQVAQSSIAHVDALIDEYVGAWGNTYREVCEATHVRHERSEALLDRAMGCLGRRHDDMAAAIELLVQSDATIALRAVDIVGSMQPLQRCQDLGFLSSRVEPPRPDVEAEVSRIRAALGLVRALREATKHAEAEQAVREAVEAANLVDYAPVLAEAKLELGLVLAARDQTTDAGVALEDAAWVATEAAHDMVAMRAAIALVGPKTRNRIDEEGAQRWARRARRLLAEHPSPRDAAILDLNLAETYRRDRNGDAARPAIDRARAAFAELGLQDTAPGFDAASAYVAILHTQGRAEAALAAAEPLPTRVAAVYGDRHPRHAKALMTLGTLLTHGDEPQRGVQRLQQAIEILTAAPGPPSRYLAGAHNNLGYYHLRAKDYAAARTHYEAARSIWEQNGLAAVDSLIYAHNNLAGLDSAQQRWREAIVQFERGLELVHDTQNGRHALRTEMEVGLSEAVLRIGDRVRARKLLVGVMGTVVDTRTVSGAGRLRRVANLLVELEDHELVAALSPSLLAAYARHPSLRPDLPKVRAELGLP